MSNPVIKSEQTNVKDWRLLPIGTKAAKVLTYNDSGKLVDITYVIYSSKDDDFYNELGDAKAVAPGYMTDTVYVTRANNK